MQHAYFSAEMASRTGTVFWQREDGSEVECTAVTTPPHTLGWGDVEDRGPVVKFVRTGMRSDEARISDAWTAQDKEIASLRARIAELEKMTNGECADAHRALASGAPLGLQPSAFDPFREAEQDRDLKDAIGKALWRRGGNHPGDWERIETDYRVEACFQAIREAGYAVVAMAHLGARGEEDAIASGDAGEKNNG